MTPTPDPNQVSAISWGSVPDWIVAVATVGAFVAAGIALIFTIRAVKYAAESNRTSIAANDIMAAAYKSDVKERREAQARFVYALNEIPQMHHAGEIMTWTAPIIMTTAEEGVFVEGSFKSLLGGVAEQTVAADMLACVITVYNRSEEMVSSWMVSLYDRTTGDSVAGIGLGEDALPVLPGESRTVRIDVLYRQGHHPHIGPMIEFRDSSGRLWRRRGSDPIQLVQDSDAL